MFEHALRQDRRLDDVAFGRDVFQRVGERAVHVEAQERIVFEALRLGRVAFVVGARDGRVVEDVAVLRHEIVIGRVQRLQRCLPVAIRKLVELRLLERVAQTAPRLQGLFLLRLERDLFAVRTAARFERDAPSRYPLPVKRS